MMITMKIDVISSSKVSGTGEVVWVFLRMATKSPRSTGSRDGWVDEGSGGYGIVRRIGLEVNQDGRQPGGRSWQRYSVVIAREPRPIKQTGKGHVGVRNLGHREG